MSRDMDLVRSILLWAEAHDAEKLHRVPVTMEGYEEAVVARHVKMMKEAGLVKANILEVPEQGIVQGARITEITWEGYEFISAARNDTIWQRAKERIQERGIDLTLDGLKVALAAVRAASGG